MYNDILDVKKKQFHTATTQSVEKVEPNVKKSLEQMTRWSVNLGPKKNINKSKF